MVLLMARPKKLPTKVVRIGYLIEKMSRVRAKKKGMSLPDYLNWKLEK